MAKTEKSLKIVRLMLQLIAIMFLISLTVFCIIIATQPHILRPLVLNDPRAAGWISLIAAGIIGALGAGVIITLFKRQLFATSLSTIETEENRQLKSEITRIRLENITLVSKNSALRGSISSIRIKVSQGVGVVQGAFTGLENINGDEG